MSHVLHALLAGYCLLNAFACAGVGARALTANRQTPPMTQSTIAMHVTQPCNILLHVATQSTLNHVLIFEMVVDPCNLVFGQLFRLPLWIDSQRKTNFDRLRATDPK